MKKTAQAQTPKFEGARLYGMRKFIVRWSDESSQGGGAMGHKIAFPL